MAELDQVQKSAGVAPKAADTSPSHTSGASTTSGALRSMGYDQGKASLSPGPLPAPAAAAAPATAPAPEAADPNAILATLTTSGASLKTAKGQGYKKGGVATSNAMADADAKRLEDLAPVFEKVAAEFDLPPALLMAIASRETRGGTQLRKDGYSRWDGQGFGIMQVDKNSHTPAGGARSEAHIRQAAAILDGFRARMAKKFPKASKVEVLRLAVSAYNCGPGNVRSADAPDKRTTGGDYSSDVWARAQRYATKDEPATP